MKTTTSQTTSEPTSPELFEEELATLTAHLNAATARWVELAGVFAREGGTVDGDVARWLAFRFGLTMREAREYLRVAEALHELPSIRAVFARGELSFTKVRVLTTVATRDSEESLLELAIALTTSQLERALRAFRRLRSEEARESHKLEYVDYYWAEDGSLFLRARLPAEDARSSCARWTLRVSGSASGARRNLRRRWGGRPSSLRARRRSRRSSSSRRRRSRPSMPVTPSARGWSCTWMRPR